MRVCTYVATSAGEDRRPRIGIVLGEEAVVDLTAAQKKYSALRKRESQSRIIPSDMIAFLEEGVAAWEAAEEILKLANSGHIRKAGVVLSRRQVRLLAPIPRPSKILAVIVNTRGMLGGGDIEMNHPRLFMKAPNTVIGPEAEILAPRYGVRPEVELAAVIGRQVRRASIKEAEKAIFGYTIFNDVTAPRDAREDSYEAYRRDPATGEIRRVRLRGPLFRSKNHDTFGPMGPWIVTRDQLLDVANLKMTTRFDGEVVQSGRTSELIFSPPEVVQFISDFLTLEPGDVVATGTIGWTAVGSADPAEWVLPSSHGVLELEIEGIGVLRNRVKPLR